MKYVSFGYVVGQPPLSLLALRTFRTVLLRQRLIADVPLML